MEYKKLALKDGKLETVFSKTIDQSTLTAECWSIQFQGLSACLSCEYLGKKQCGGKKLRKKMIKAIES